MTSRQLAIVAALGCAGLAAVGVLKMRGSAGELARQEIDFVGDPVIAIDSRGRFYINALPTDPDDLVPRIRRILQDTVSRRVYLKADKRVRYAAVLEVMDALREAHIENVALVGDRP